MQSKHKVLRLADLIDFLRINLINKQSAEECRSIATPWRSSVMAFWDILANYKITFKLKEAWKY